MDWEMLGKWAAAIVSILVASGLVIRVAISRRTSKRSNVRIVSQKNNIVGGDMIAGNSFKRNNK